MGRRCLSHASILTGKSPMVIGGMDMFQLHFCGAFYLLEILTQYERKCKGRINNNCNVKTVFIFMFFFFFLKDSLLDGSARTVCLFLSCYYRIMMLIFTDIAMEDIRQQRRRRRWVVVLFTFFTLTVLSIFLTTMQ